MAYSYRSLNPRGGTHTSNPIAHLYRRTLDIARRDLRATTCAACILSFLIYLIIGPSASSERFHLPDVSTWTSGLGSFTTPKLKAGDVISTRGFLRIRMPLSLIDPDETELSPASDPDPDSTTDSTSSHTSNTGPTSAIYLMPRHPILQLIEEAKSKKEEMEELKESVDSLEAAVADYKRAFGMDPPEGFDGWYKFASSHHLTTTPSLLPEAHNSILPYLALPPHLLRTRVLALQKDTGVFGMSIYPDGKGPRGGFAGEDDGDGKKEKVELGGLMGISGEDFMVGYMSPRHDYPDLLSDIIPLLPLSQQPESPVHLSVCVRDGACTLSAGPLMEASRKLARLGNVWDQHKLLQEEIKWAGNRGWGYTCDSPLRDWDLSASPTSFSTAADKSFISDNDVAMDFCQHPDLIGQVGEMIMESQHVMRPLAPMLAVSRPLHGADMLGTPTRAVKNLAEESHVHWDVKTRRQAVWRGTATGVYHRDRWDWRSSQRHRLSRFAWNATDEKVQVMVERGGAGEVVLEAYSQKELVEKWLDIGLVKEDIGNLCGPGPTGDSCRLDGSHPYPTCPEREAACDIMEQETKWVNHMALEDSVPYRYRLDVDGYGWSSRWRKVLSTNAVVLKCTIYPEWWTAQGIPWYHYIPLNYDYSDLWDLMSFLDGAPDGSTTGRQDLAQEIAWNGKVFADEELSWESMQSYMYLLLLEYRRAWSDDRVAASFVSG